MNIDEDLKKINNRITKLRNERLEMTRNYVRPHVEKVIEALKNFKDFRFEIESWYFDNEEEHYDIVVNIPVKGFKEKMKRAHRLIELMHDTVDDEFATKKIFVVY